MLLIEQSSGIPVGGWLYLTIFLFLPLLGATLIFIEKFFFTHKEYVWLDKDEDVDILRGDKVIVVWSINPEYPMKFMRNKMPEDENVKDNYDFYLKYEVGDYSGGIHSKQPCVYKRIVRINYLGREQYDKAWKYYRDRDKTIDETIRKYISQSNEVFANPPQDKNNPELWLPNNWIWFLQWNDKKVEFMN